MEDVSKPHFVYDIFMFANEKEIPFIQNSIFIYLQTTLKIIIILTFKIIWNKKKLEKVYVVNIVTMKRF